jgi:hypothetical protein
MRIASHDPRQLGNQRWMFDSDLLHLSDSHFHLLQQPGNPVINRTSSIETPHSQPHWVSMQHRGRLNDEYRCLPRAFGS